MKAVILGAAGQDGPYLETLLRRQGCAVITTARHAPHVILDVQNREAVFQLVREHKPDYLFQLAAASATRHELLFDHHNTIAGGALHVLEAIYRHAPHCKVFLPGSGLQFQNTGKPIGEQDPFEARDAYSLARIAAVHAARYYRSLGVKAYVGYFFNHDSPRRGGAHLNRRIINDIRAIREGKQNTLEIGDPTIKKEFGLAAEIMEATWTLVQQDIVYEAVLGTGLAHSIQEWIDACLKLAGLPADSAKYIRTVPGFQRPYEVLVSNPATINRLGWKVRTSLSELAALMWNSTDPLLNSSL